MPVSKKKTNLKKSVKHSTSQEAIIPDMPLIPQIRWDKVQDVMVNILTALYSNHLTYNEIDVIIGLISTRTLVNKVVPEVLGQVHAELDMELKAQEAERNKRKNEAPYIT